MKRIKYLFIISAVVLICSCTKFLDRKNLDTFTSDNFWKSETNMRLYIQGFYTDYFVGYGQNYTYGSVFSWAPWADDQVSSSQWTTNPATSGNGWSFSGVRRANIVIARTDEAPISDEAKNHWKGVGRFFRAMEYTTLAKNFGDVPIITSQLLPDQTEELYKPRDPLAKVVESMLADYEFAATNVRLDDGVQQVNRYVVLAFMSRDLLYFGSYLKYHGGDHALANKLFEKAAWAANQIINSKKFTVADDYRGLFTSENLASNKEVIFFREYVEAKVTHAILSYNYTEGQTGLTKNAYDSYLAADGLPIKQSPSYNYSVDNGERNFRATYRNRDPRLYGTIVDSLRFNKVDAAASSTGIASWKFLPETVTSETKYSGAFNVTDAPIIRYGEVLLNYIEAVAELGTITQNDVNTTINALHNRNIKLYGQSVAKLPPFTLAGGTFTANGIAINDPDRDPAVSSLLWEIRRERRVELMFEGLRQDDLRRWKKFEYLNTMEAKNGNKATTLGIGAYVDTLDYPRITKTATWKALINNSDIRFYFPNPNDKSKGYIYGLWNTSLQRDWVSGQSFFERQYLRSVPLDQINMYKDMGVTLSQNPGWE